MSLSCQTVLAIVLEKQARAGEINQSDPQCPVDGTDCCPVRTAMRTLLEVTLALKPHLTR